MKRNIVILITAFILTGLLNFTSVSFAQKLGKWAKKAEMHTMRSDLALAAVGGKIYAIAGRNHVDGRLSVVEEYNPATDTWKKVADIPTAREGHGAAAVNGKIYVFGGNTTVKRRNGTKVLKSVKNIEEYDPATNTWAQKRRGCFQGLRCNCLGWQDLCHEIGTLDIRPSHGHMVRRTQAD